MGNKKNWFTSDWHKGEASTPNTHSYLRPYSTSECVEKWIEQIHRTVPFGDRIVFVGDVAIQLLDLHVLVELHRYDVVLILGDKETGEKNYKYGDFIDFMNLNYPDIPVYPSINVTVNGREYFVAHKPEDCLKQELPSICGHIHGIWRTAQMPNGEAIINVSADAWGGIVSEEFIDHQYNAITKYYDINAKPYNWFADKYKECPDCGVPLSKL